MKLNRRSFLTTAGIATAAAATGWSRARGQTVSSPSKTGGLVYRSVSELRAMLDSRRVSAMELLEHAIARIEAHDPRINALAIRDFEKARVSAGAADRGHADDLGATDGPGMAAR
jgi:amidase